MGTTSAQQSSWLRVVLGILVVTAALSLLAAPAGTFVIAAFCLALAVILSATVEGHKRAKVIAVALLGLMTVWSIVAGAVM